MNNPIKTSKSTKLVDGEWVPTGTHRHPNMTPVFSKEYVNSSKFVLLCAVVKCTGGDSKGLPTVKLTDIHVLDEKKPIGRKWRFMRDHMWIKSNEVHFLELYNKKGKQVQFEGMVTTYFDEMNGVCKFKVKCIRDVEERKIKV